MEMRQALLPRVERDEARLVTLSALSFVCVAAGALVARSAGDALFLSYFGAARLPVMYVAGAVVSAVVTYACIRASRRSATSSIAVVAGSLLVAANLVLFATFGLLPSFARAGAYLVADVSVRIPVFLFWAFSSELFDAPQSRRLFGLIGSAGTAACLPAGLAVGPIARRAGAESLVLLSALLMAGFIATTVALSRANAKPQAASALRTGGRASVRGVVRTPQLATIASLAVITAVVETVVDFQFKTTAASMAGSTALANIFGTLYAAASVASLVIQLLVVHRMLAVAGALVSLCVLPSALLLSEAGVFRFRSWSWVFLTKALDVTLATTINGTTRQLLYRGIRKESRLTARALADGLFLPLAIGTAGAGLAAVRGSISVQAAAIAAAAGCVLWLLLARSAHAAYVAGLIDSLQARQFGAGDEELFTRSAGIESWIRTAFASSSDDDLIYLASLLPQFRRVVRPAQLQAALARDNPRVKVAMLQALAAADVGDRAALARPLLGHPDEEVRRAAVFACGHPAEVSSALADASSRVRAAAAAVFAASGRKEAAQAGRNQLHAFATSPDPQLRAAAAEALEHAVERTKSDRGFRTELLRRLVADRDTSVARVALETVKATRVAALAGPVVALLSNPVLSGPASDALAAIGSPVIDVLLPLDAPHLGAIVAAIPQVLERIGDPRGLDVLARLLTVRRPDQRTAVFHAYVQLLAKTRETEALRETINALIAVECVGARARLKSARLLGENEAARAARDSVGDLASCHVANAFILLGGRLRDIDTNVLHRQIVTGTAEQRSNAIELLENVVPKELRDLFVAMFDAPAAAVSSVEDEVPKLLWDRDSEWVVAGAALAAAELALANCGERLQTLLTHESDVVRETAGFALGRLQAAP